ncbi:MAG: formamidopyrimidine-DNA glycosylase [Frankiales bacterium]|nr:formamidopyrimidine-DNA glycosylase [Frankiales bacterium]
MPELPEVEVVRSGLERWVVGRTIEDVRVSHPRAVRRHVAGGADLAARLRGATVTAARRRGKFLWMPLDTGEALQAHLGMSGQLLVESQEAPEEAHLHVRVRFGDGGDELRFVDQRTFGGLAVIEDGEPVPPALAHVAPDPLEEAFDDEAFVGALRRRRTGIKRALLDQGLISGVGNIYADEALWRARLHWARATEGLPKPKVRELLGHLREVFADALRQGGTSFDSLYVNVNGESGYFDRSLNVYGREGAPCYRCGSLIRREAFMSRSSYRCPRCQPVPRHPHW